MFKMLTEISNFYLLRYKAHQHNQIPPSQEERQKRAFHILKVSVRPGLC